MPDTAAHRPYGSPIDASSGPRRSLILAGGGMRVAYQAGVVRALLEAGLTFAHADGTSGGVINLAMLLSGLSPEEMCERWRTLNARDFISFMPAEQYLKALDMRAMGSADGVRDKVFPHLGIDVERIRAADGMVGTFNVCNFTRKTLESIPNDAIELDLLIAGVSLPIFMPPVTHNDSLYADAVWIKDANLMEAVRRGAEELWVVWCIGNTGEYKNGMFDQYVHMIELSANGGLFEEFDRIAEINTRIAKGEPVYGHSQPIKLHLIKSEYPLPLDPDLYFGRISTATLIDMGYADASRYLAVAGSEGLPFQPDVTGMQEDQAGITFSETMTGGFALGATDPADGDVQGKVAGTAMTMHCTINVHDLARFVADPDHTGGITGHISFPAFGEDIPAQRGVFNLFQPTDQPQHTRMVYELAFRHEGRQYYLAGRKEVRHDPLIDIWRDTTTLFTQLHEGPHKSGPVVGAGILHIQPNDLAKLIAALHATHADSLGERAQAMLRFGRFFAGELWETYARGRGGDEAMRR